MGIGTIAVIGALLLVVVVCAILRVNIWTLLPWYPGAPHRFDDGVEQLGIDRQSADKHNQQQ
jgi:hypothetical protein